MRNEEMIEDLRGLCRFASVTERTSDPAAPYGKEVAGAMNYVLDLCQRWGFRVKNCDHQIGYAEIGQGDEMIGVLVHLDVVPAGEGWDTPAYDVTEKDGRLYGRGVSDDKGPAIAVLYGMRDLLEEQVSFQRRIRIIFGQTEEAGGWSDMAYYVDHEELPTMGFTPDGDFPAIYGEKGILQLKVTMDKERAGLLSASGGSAANVVPNSASASIPGSDGPLSFSATGKAAHASMPWRGVNAISKLMTGLCRVRKAPYFAKFYAEVFGEEYTGALAGVDFSDEQSGALTLNVGLLSCNEDKVTLTLDIRYPVTIAAQTVIEALQRRVEPYGAEVEVIEQLKPVYLDKDSDLMRALLFVYRSFTGDDSEPLVIGGGTYARAMDHIVAFGPGLPGREMTEHQSNEYMEKEDFFLLRKIYREALRKLAC